MARVEPLSLHVDRTWSRGRRGNVTSATRFLECCALVVVNYEWWAAVIVFATRLELPFVWGPIGRDQSQRSETGGFYLLLDLGKNWARTGQNMYALTPSHGIGTLEDSVEPLDQFNCGWLHSFFSRSSSWHFWSRRTVTWRLVSFCTSRRPVR